MAGNSTVGMEREEAPHERWFLLAAEMSPLFQMVLEATEEAVYNALFMATTTTGRNRTYKALPLDEVRRLYVRIVAADCSSSGSERRSHAHPHHL